MSAVHTFNMPLDVPPVPVWMRTSPPAPVPVVLPELNRRCPAPTEFVLPTSMLIEPAAPPVAAPVPMVTEPVLPLVELPVLKVIAPEAPPVVTLPVAISKSPVLADAAPDDKMIAPPCPLELEPVALPVAIVTAPLKPLALVPELNNMTPVPPVEPAFPVRITTTPEPVEPEPDDICTVPPAAAVAVPAVITIGPPACLPEPTTIDMEPAVPDTADPVLMSRFPLDAVVDDPAMMWILPVPDFVAVPVTSDNAPVPAAELPEPIFKSPEAAAVAAPLVI